jgi:hypothetical protein
VKNEKKITANLNLMPTLIEETIDLEGSKN